MSTILKALKKLEEGEKPFKGGGLPSGYMGPGSPHVQPPRGLSRLAGPLLRRSMIALMILSLAAAAFFFYRQSRFTTATTPTAAGPPGKPPIGSKPPSQAPPSAQAPSRIVASPPVATAPGNASAPGTQMPRKPLPASKAVPVDSGPDKAPHQSLSAAKPRIGVQSTEPAPLASRPLVEPSPPDKVNVSRPTPAGRPPAPTLTGKQSPANKPVVSKPAAQPESLAEKKPTPPPEDADEDIASLSDGRLRIQAIAWSSVVEDRMAVINTRIVREGDKVDGFLVLTIRRDDVVVREKGVLYRVEFGRP